MNANSTIQTNGRPFSCSPWHHILSHCSQSHLQLLRYTLLNMHRCLGEQADESPIRLLHLKLLEPLFCRASGLQEIYVTPIYYVYMLHAELRATGEYALHHSVQRKQPSAQPNYCLPQRHRRPTERQRLRFVFLIFGVGSDLAVFFEPSGGKRTLDTAKS